MRSCARAVIVHPVRQSAKTSVRRVMESPVTTSNAEFAETAERMDLCEFCGLCVDRRQSRFSCIKKKRRRSKRPSPVEMSRSKRGALFQVLAHQLRHREHIHGGFATEHSLQRVI